MQVKNELKRNLESKIDRLLKKFPAVLIIGPRQAGKTTVSKAVRPYFRYVDVEDLNVYNRIISDPMLFFQSYSENVIIDEAQKRPEIFSILRGLIDADRQKMGRFIITGSASPELLKHAGNSLAGRVAILELSPLKANEYAGEPLSDFYKLIKDKNTKARDFLELKSKVNLSHTDKVWLQGGYPEPLLQDDIDAKEQWFRDYYTNYIKRDVSELFPRLDQVAFAKFLKMLSHTSGTILNKSDVARNVEVKQKTISSYLDIAEGTFLWRNLSPYSEHNSMKSFTKMPKGFFRDSGLLHYFNRVPLDDLLRLQDSNILGNSFESFVIEEVLKGVEASSIVSCDASYYRTRGTGEIDLILQGSFGIAPIEIKYRSQVQVSKVKTLRDFVKSHNLNYGIVINHGSSIEMIDEKIVEIPINYI